MADSRKIIRGKCLHCSTQGGTCAGYIPPPSGLKCSVCSHPPGQHERLGVIDTPGIDADDAHCHDQVVEAPPLASDAEEVTLCSYKGCGKAVDFDLNTGEESNFCDKHATFVQSGVCYQISYKVWLKFMW